METIKKLINYYWSVIKKYGIILPVALAVVGFGVMLTVDLVNIPTLLLKNNLVWLFVICVVLVVGALAFGTYYTFTKLTDKELGIQDLGITCITAVAILSLLMFIFTTKVAVALTFIKWFATAAVAALCVVLAIFRTKNVD